MIFTLYYMYATFVQWWRIGNLRQRLKGTLNEQNALLLCSNTSCIGTADNITSHQRSLENLLYQQDGRIACTIVPRQKLHLGQWAAFPRNRKCFPIHYGHSSSIIPSRSKHTGVKSFYVLLQASLENTPSSLKVDFIQMEKFGELIAWRANDFFEVVLRTDLEHVTILLNSFKFHLLGVNHDLPLVKIETVDVDGAPTKLKYDGRPSKFKFSHGPAQFREFANRLRQLYSKINENLNPKIMIENTKTQDYDKKPISEVKPIKKHTKNTLDVHHGSSSHKKTKSKKEEDKDVFDAKETKEKKSHKSKKDETVVVTNNKLEEKQNGSEEEAKVAAQVKVQVEDVSQTPKKLEDLSLEQPTIDTNVKEDVKPVETGTTSKKSSEKVKSEEKTKIKEEKTKEKLKIKDKTKSEEKLLKEKTKAEEKVKPPKEISKSLFREKSKEKEKGKEKSKKANEPTTSSATLSVTKKSYSDVTATPGKNLQRQNATSSKETSPNRNAKPPNILVYADTSLAKENVKSVLKTIINKDKYTIYDLPTEIGSTQFWNSTTTLVIVCGAVPSHLTPHLLDYLVGGGQLLCLCSDLIYSVLHPFSTAEVREHELVRFTYGEWKRVRMMHHIFCYQASPAKKQFSREASDQSMNGGSTGSSPVAPRTPSIVDIQHVGQKYTIQVQILGTEETWQTPSLLLATVKNPLAGGGNGKAIFSQVHLEVDPMQYQDDECKYAALKDSNQARLEILKHILTSHLDIDCSSKDFGDLKYQPAYFLGRHDLKMELINNSAIITNGKLQMAEIELEFYTKNIEPKQATIESLPVLVLRCPSNFSTVEYFDTLTTEKIGRLVIYADIIASSQRLLASKLSDGIVVIARRQTAGKGRSGNEWLSPEGCAMCSLQVHIPLDSHLGRSLSLLQHLVMVAIVKAVKTSSKIEPLEIGIKWPNDLYAYGNIKIGGLIAATTVENQLAIVTIGFGINLDNREPTICINDMIKDADKNNSGLSPENFFASVFNEVEELINNVQENGIDFLLDYYYKYWLHKDANITVTTANGESKNVIIKGVDSFGFLLVQDENGTLSSVQSDGNTFDMLRGLIAPKLTS